MRKILLLLLASLWLYADGPVLKTGQTTVYQTGDDGTYQEGIARSYTRDNVNGIVTDNATGLVWQDDAVGSTMNWTSAGTYCENLTLGGQTGWRLPAIEELKMLLNYEGYPSVDPTFLNREWYGYWSSTVVASSPSSHAWVADFYNGSDVGVTKSVSQYVRCVRGTSTSAISYTRDNATQAVYDSQSNLTWQDDANTSSQTLNWSNAINYCEALNFAGVDDWRLPNFNELYMIAERTRIHPAINSAFINIALDNYWSSTTGGLDDSLSAWDVNFDDGGDGWGSSDNKSYLHYVRCVRSGQLPTSSSSSSSSSSIYINPNQVYASVQITEGWNLISVPFNTDDEFDITSLVQNMATIGWKFKYITNNGDEYHWDKWEKGTNLKLKNGEGFFIGIPSTILPRPSDYIQFQGIRTDTLLKFENKTYVQNKWYLLGFGYEVKVSDILALYPNGVVWGMENGAYKKLSDTDTLKLGQGFWFKY